VFFVVFWAKQAEFGVVMLSPVKLSETAAIDEAVV